MSKSLLRVRAEAFRRQDGRCCYCGILMWADDCVAFAERHGISVRLARWLQCTSEHLLARRDGGRDSCDNVAAACRWCNQRRYARKKPPVPEQYRRVVTARMARGRWHVTDVHRSGLVRC